MKRVVGLVALLLMVIPVAASAGGVDITLLGGYQFLGELDSDQTKLTIPADWAFGLIAGFDVRHDGQVELVFQRQVTEMHQDRGDFQPSLKLFDLAMEYYHIGGLYEPTPRGDLRPIVVGSLGVTHMNPLGEDRSSEWRFSGALGGGIKFQKPNSRFALRAQSRIWGTFFNSSTSIFCSGNQCLISIAGTILVQIDVSAGLTFRFGS